MIDRTIESELIRHLKAQLPGLKALLDESSSHWGYEDPIYRFYHHSYKVFALQSRTEQLVSALRGLLPGRSLNAWFLQIVSEGTGKDFSPEMNAVWEKHTRPILEAFFHARFFLEMAVRYADLPAPPEPLPSGWAALLVPLRAQVTWHRFRPNSVDRPLLQRVGTTSRDDSNVTPARSRTPRSNVASTPLRRLARARR